MMDGKERSTVDDGEMCNSNPTFGRTVMERLLWMRYAPRGLPDPGALLRRPEKNDISFSLSILPASCVVGGVVTVSFARLASRSCT
jgi:hypothetical protein